MDDSFNLQRFVDAQNAGNTYAQAVAELRRGRKTTHWIWYVFPQIAGLGYSSMSRKYAIASLAEARAYLAHPVLGPRLRECTTIVAEARARTALEIFGEIDTLKLQSSMTLFLRADPAESLFQRVLDRYYGGQADSATDRLLAKSNSSSLSS